MSPVVLNLNITFFPADASLSNIKRGFHIHTFGVSAIDEDPTKSKFISKGLFMKNVSD